MSRDHPTLRGLALVFALSGSAGLLHEVAWARVLGQTLGNSLEGLTAALAAFLGGLGLGAAVAARLAPRSGRPLRIYAVLEGLLAVVALLFPVWLRLLHQLLGAFGPACGSTLSLVLLRLGGAVLVLAPAALLMGATLPYLLRASVLRKAPPGTALAVLYGSNCLGAAAGALLGSFVFLPM